jgi:hypothetical protein
MARRLVRVVGSHARKRCIVQEKRDEKKKKRGDDDG